MPDLLAQAIATPGVAWLSLAVIVAGLVRGFAGFGSAMIIMPVAASVLSPVEAILFMTAAELIGPLPNLPDALREGAPREVGRLLLGVLIGMPLGLWGLSLMSPEGFGWIVSGVVLGLLALLLAGYGVTDALLAARLATASCRRSVTVSPEACSRTKPVRVPPRSPMLPLRPRTRSCRAKSP